eukprot:4292783-Pleurochrysis_carterae.AAC.6
MLTTARRFLDASRIGRYRSHSAARLQLGHGKAATELTVAYRPPPRRMLHLNDARPSWSEVARPSRRHAREMPSYSSLVMLKIVLRV